ncbi:matrixin family metalloprotease [Burkholderia cenocepacia]|uniref:matrixin family metalloprotease n=1 Tax=Burkholderia cenocepacia TaxID=95486 RepID=UPI002AB6DA9C|nr:matrixin family metalloprotease [Burkholderia cenocepacia]
MSNFDTPITGQETMWGPNFNPTDEELKLINSSPLLVSELNAYQQAVDQGLADPIAQFPLGTNNKGFDSLQTITHSETVNGQSVIVQQIQLGLGILGGSDTTFVGDLSYELGHFMNFSKDQQLYDNLVLSSNSSDPNFQINSGVIGTITEAESEANNFAVQQQILKKTGQLVKLNGDVNSNGTLQATLDQTFSQDKTQGVDPSQDLNKFEQAVSGLMGTLQFSTDGNFFDYYANHPQDLQDYMHPPSNDSTSTNGVQGSQEDVTAVSINYDPAAGVLSTTNITQTDGSKEYLTFTNNEISSAIYTDGQGNITSQVEYTHNSDGSYSANFTDGAGHLTDTQNVAVDGSYSDIQYNINTGLEISQTNYNASGIETYKDDYNSSGQLVSEENYNSAGQEVDQQLVTPGTLNVYEKLIFDPGTGQETAQQNFNTSGQLTSQDNYTSGELVSQDDYNSAGQEVDRLLVTPGTTNVYEKLVFDPGTGQETAQQNFNTSGQLTSQDDFNASGQLVTQENYNTAGQETEQIFVAPGTSNITKEVFFDPTTGKETYQEDFDASGNLTTRDDYNTSGQLVSQENYNAVGQEIEQLLVVPGTTTVTQGIFYDTNGKVTSISNYDTSGNETSRTSYNADGLRTEQQIFDTSTGEETERDLYATPGSSTASTVMEFASSGWESFQNDYDSNGGLLSQENFDTGDGHLISKEIVVGGLETEQLLYTPGWQYASSEIFFNSNGTENAQFSFDSTGQETQEDMFGGASLEFERLIFNSGSQFANTEIHYNSNGVISQQFTFNDSGQELEQDDYNGAGQQIDAFRYNAGMQYAYREDIFQPGEPFSQQGISFDQLTGQSTGETTFDPATGIPISSDPNWNQFDAILNGGTGSTGGTYYSGSGYGFVALEGGDGAIFGGFGFAGAAGASNLDQNGIASLLMSRLGMQDDPADQAAFNQALDQVKNSAEATPSFGSGTPNVEGHWDKSVITWSVSNLDANGLPLDASAMAQYSQTLEQAFATWSAQTGIVFNEVSDGTASDIRIDWSQFDTSTTGVIGFTSAKMQNGMTITNAHIQLEDPTQTAFVPTSAGALLYSGTQATLEQTALHEIGHALGLGDTSDANSVMYYELTGQNRTLDVTDQLGAQRVGVNSQVSPDTQLGQWVQALSSYSAPAPASFQANGHVVTAIHPTLASSLR